jgi:nitrate reductase gamma subunit
MYEILTGPLLWISFAVFFVGLTARVVLYFKGLDWRLDRVAYKPHMNYGIKGAVRSVYRWLLPFGTHSWRAKPIFTLMFFAFHIGLVIVPVFLEGHAVMIRNGLGIDWPSMPQILADVLAIAALMGGIGIAVRRFLLPEVRILTDFKDVMLLVLTLTLLCSGIMASYHTANYSLWINLHILCGVIVLLTAPFTKLAHIALFFCTRIQLGMDFGIKRGGMKSNFDW